MKLKTLFALTVALTPIFASAQVSQSIKDSEKTLFKIQQLSIIKFITPVLMKKSQINALLTTIEKCRAKELEIRELDAKKLKEIDADVDKAIESSINDGSYPKAEFQKKLIVLQEAILIRRKIATGEMVDMMLDTCRKTLDAGQMNVIKNLIDPKFVDGSIKVDQMTDDEKIKLYIRQIFLDGIAYDVLKQLAKKASE